MTIYTEFYNGITDKAFAILPICVVDWASFYKIRILLGWLFWAIEIKVDA